MPFSAFASCAEAVDAKAANTIAPTIPINTRFIWSPLRKAALEMLPCRRQRSTLHDRGPGSVALLPTAGNPAAVSITSVLRAQYAWQRVCVLAVHTRSTRMIYMVAESVSEALRAAVLAELNADPAVHAWEIGVAAEDGVVTLTGTVDNAGNKFAAERAAKRVEVLQQVVDGAELLQVLRRCLRPHAGDAGDVVDRVADERLVVDHLLGLDAPVADQRLAIEDLLLAEVEDLDAIGEQLSEILV